MTTEATTKQCPYCAETIQAAAIVCRYCGRDLVPSATAPAPSPAPPAVSPDDRALMQQEIARLTTQGWQVVSQTEGGAQLKKPKEWSKVGVALFVGLPALGALFYGPLIYVAILGLLLVLADYLMKKEQLFFLTPDQLRESTERKRLATEQPYVEKLSNGGTVCSKCRQYVRADATECKHCKVSLTPLTHP